ncbi:MAG: hypothetical protein R6X14_10190 [bacterium]
MLTLLGTMPREPQFLQNLCADMQGFSPTPPCAARRTTAKLRIVTAKMGEKLSREKN